MKKFSLVVCMLFMLHLLSSAIVPVETIKLVAEKWLEFQTGQPRTAVNWEAYPNSENPAYWRVNCNIGFVYVSADNSCIPILAFCKLGTYSTFTVTEAAQELLSDYTLQIEDAKTNMRSNTETLPMWNAIINQTISIAEEHDIGLVTTIWEQWGGGESNNTYCPMDNHNLHYEDPQYPEGRYKRSVVGCVATAVAQICNYYKRWNYFLQDSDRYTSDNYGFVCEIDSYSSTHDFPDFATLNGYLEEVIDKYTSSTPLTVSDKAALSFACGILTHTNYSSISSGAYDSCSGSVYDKNNMYHQPVNGPSLSSEAWGSLIKKQLTYNRPIQYAGGSIEGGSHAFIVTGYQTTNFNTTLNLINWGRHWCHPEYWSLQPINLASPYPNSHTMRIGISPNASINQTILLEGGGTDFSGINLQALGHDGIWQTFTTDNGVFDIKLPPGTYDFTFSDSRSYYETLELCDVVIEMGVNPISPNPIILHARPHIIEVPTNVSNIQEAIDLVRDGGTVVILDGNYIVHGLKWESKHITLQGQTQSGVTISNDPDFELPAITLSGNEINNQDRISNITFQNCDLLGLGGKRGAAIELGFGAAPMITNCTFDGNCVGNTSISELQTGVGVGGAVFISGRRSSQVFSPKFINCIFTNNYTLEGNGGGAVALYGRAQFSGCEFTNNKSMDPDGIEIPRGTDHGGAVLIYMSDHQGDIEFNNCLFNNNRGSCEADDVFVANTDRLSSLSFNNCTFTADNPPYNEAKPAIKFLTEAGTYSDNMHAQVAFTYNKFLSSHKGAVYFCDYYGKNRLTFTGNVVANNMNDGYGLYLWYPDDSSPVSTDCITLSNNTFSNINGSGIILYQCPLTTINNTIFENCSSNGVSWGGYDQENPHWAGRGLTLNNCLFSLSYPRYDTGGSVGSPLTENAVDSVQNMHLDNFYKPIWNSSTISPCIDAGIGANDPDTTPPDIGARRADTHRDWEYTFETQVDHERWYWVSYPVLNTRTNGMLQASEFFKELLVKYQDDNSFWHPTYLDEITWVVGGDPDPVHLQWLDLDWSPNQYTHNVSSPQGYKIKLLNDTPNTVTLRESGFKTLDTMQFHIYADVENWIGYFKEGAQPPQQAFSSIWDDIELIKAKNWGLQRDPSTGLLIGKSGVLNYGDMVIVVTNNEHDFRWANGNVVPPHTKQPTKSFTFDEKQDYVPVYVSLPDSLVGTVKEVGLYVDGVCKGAVVVEDSLEQISAYVDSASELSQGNVEFVFSYEESKSHAGGLASISLNSSRTQVKQSITANKYPYFEVSFTEEDMINVVPLEYNLGQNYPNPFNPSTTLSYTLPGSASVHLDIYNLKGQLVKTLVDSTLEAGHHSAVWNGKDMNNRNVASGVYLYRLSCPDKTITKKMLLMK